MSAQQLSVLLALWASTASAASVVAVTPFVGDAPSAERRAVVDDVGTAVVAVGDAAGLSLQPVAATAATAQEMGALGLGCALPGTACLLRTGGLCGARFAIGGVVDVDGDVLVVRLSAVDVATQQALPGAKELRVRRGRGRPSDAVAGDAAVATRAEDARALQQAVVRLLAPEQDVGTLVVRTATGVTVAVDGVVRGVTPLAAPLVVRPGRHEVWLGRVGFVSATHNVDVAFGAPVELAVTLVAEEDPGRAAAPLALPSTPTPTTTTTTTTTTAEAPARVVRRIAVYDVVASGLAPHLGPLMQSALTTELRKLDGAIVVGMDEIRTMLDREAARQLSSCDEDESCLAGIADALGAQTLVTTSVAALSADEVTVTATRIDTATMAVREKFFARVKPDEGRALIAAVGPVVEKLFADVPLAPGASRGVDKRLIVRANPPPLPPAVTWAGASVAGVAAAGAGVLGAWNLSLWNSLHTETDGATRVRESEELVWSAQGFYAAAVVCGVAAAGTGVVAAFLTDWDAPVAGVAEAP
jgi:hypothetical protein